MVPLDTRCNAFVESMTLPDGSGVDGWVRHFVFYDGSMTRSTLLCSLATTVKDYDNDTMTFDDSRLTSWRLSSMVHCDQCVPAVRARER